MNIYFHIDELNRDAVVASALKRKFFARGHTLVYGNRITNRLLKHFHARFDLIIVPRPHFLYDNWGDEWLSWRAKFVMLSTESLGIIATDPRVMARTLLEKGYFEGEKKYVDRVDAFCLWGHKQFLAIQEYANEIAEKCHVVGHPRHDLFCRNWNRNAFSENAEKHGTKRIGFITRAVGLNDYFGRCALDGFSTLLDNHFLYEYFNKETGEKLASRRPAAQPAEALIVQAIDVASTLKAVAALVSAGHEVQIRVHPKETVGAWASLLERCGVRVVIADPKLPIALWLEGLDYILGPPSTSFYDAVMLGVTPVSISELDSRRKSYVGELWEDNNSLMPYIYKPKSVDELLSYINSSGQIAINESIERVLRDEADYPLCITSLDKVVEVCETLIRSGEKMRHSLVAFSMARAIFISLWKFKSRWIRRKENSASFSLDRKTMAFIDGLSMRKLEEVADCVRPLSNATGQ